MLNVTVYEILKNKVLSGQLLIDDLKNDEYKNKLINELESLNNEISNQ